MFIRRVALSVARLTPARAPIAARTFTSSVVCRKTPPELSQSYNKVQDNKY